MSKTLFKKIIDKEIPADIVYEDELCLAFRDIHPQAPVHLLVIPKQEIASMNEVTDGDLPLLGHILGVVQKLAKTFALDNGYRIVNNCGDDGGQTVKHLHFHLLGGRQMSWPPG